MSVPKLRFKQFTDDFEKNKLVEHTKWSSGGTPSKDNIEYWNGDIPLISGASMHTQRFFKSDVNITELGLKKGSKLAPKDSILILVRGSMLFNKIPMGLTLKDVAFNQDVKCIQPSKSLNSIFLFQWLLSKENIIQNKVTSTGIGAGKLDTVDLQNLEIIVPKLEEQTKIASFLSTVDEKIAQLNQKHELLSQYKQGMIQKLFSQQIRFKADDGSEFGEWKDIQLKDFLNLTLRPIIKPENNYHALGVRSHFKGLFNKYDSEPEKISMDTLYRVEKDDVVVNITFAWEGAMAIAKSEHDQGLVSHRFPTYRCDESSVHLLFFKYRFIQKDFLSHLQLCSPGGAGRNRVLNKKAFLEINFSKPCLEEQTKIANFLSAIDQKIEVVAKQIEQAKQWKKGLLQQMFV